MAKGKTGLRVGLGARSDTGMVRKNNEDSFAVDLPLNLFILCDGMGGQAAGEVASKLGVDIILEHCRHASKNPHLGMIGAYRPEFSEATNRLASAIRLSNQAIHEAADKQLSTSGMGSTVVAACLTGNVLSIAHVGDSRIYMLREGELRQLTQDHSFIMEQLRRGLISREEAEHSDLSNVIMRALGAEPTVQVDLDELWMEVGDRVLLCSDGLTRKATDAQIVPILTEAKSSQEACDRLVGLANDLGGEDNVTVIVVHLKAPPLGLFQKLGRFFGGDREWPN